MATSVRGEFGRNDLLEAIGSVGSKFQGLRGFSYGDTIPVGCLKKYILGRLIDTGRLPSLDTRDADHFLRIGVLDDEHRGRERVFFVVQAHEFFPFLGETDRECDPALLR